MQGQLGLGFFSLREMLYEERLNPERPGNLKDFFSHFLMKAILQKGSYSSFP